MAVIRAAELRRVSHTTRLFRPGTRFDAGTCWTVLSRGSDVFLQDRQGRTFRRSPSDLHGLLRMAAHKGILHIHRSRVC